MAILKSNARTASAPKLKTGIAEQDLALAGFILDVTHIDGTAGYATDYAEGWRGAYWEFSNGAVIVWNIDTGEVYTTDLTSVPESELQELTTMLQAKGFTAAK